jgi:hypothetical protein
VKGSPRRGVKPVERAVAALLLATAALPAITAGGSAQEREARRPEDVSPPPPSRPEPGGAPVPLRSYTDAEGRTCRVYERRVMIDGGAATALATVCRDPSGRWVLSR